MARRKYIQEYITTGRLTLPVVVLLVSLIWLIGSLSPIKGIDSNVFWNKLLEILQGTLLRNLLGYILLGVAAVQLLILHNTFALIRTHSNFYLTLFILLGGLLVPQTLDVASIIVPCVLLTTHNLFKTYQMQQPVGYVFQAFLFIGLGSILFPPLLYYIPFFYISLINFHTLTWRTFFAGLLGICLPYWGIFAYAIFTEDMTLFYGPFLKLVPTLPIRYDGWTLSTILSLSYVLLITLTGSLHCLIYNYEDKIKTRALLSYFIALQVWTLLLLFGQPQYYSTLFPILIPGSCILGGHFFALSRTKASNLFFVVCVLLFIALISYIIWTYTHNIY